MSGIGKCCCGDCCITAGEMPYTTVTLKSPYYACSPGAGVGVGVGVGVGEGEGDPEYPTSSFSQGTCCFQAAFNFELAGLCPPKGFDCYLWAKRDVTFSYDVEYYRQQVAYELPETDPEDYNCPCILAETKSVSYEGCARVFLNQEYKMVGATVSVGKTLIQCDGDEQPVCKFYIAISYDFQVTECPSDVQVYQKKIYSCVGHYDNPNCTITNTWMEESGTDSDTCPFDEITCDFQQSSIVTVTRIKFYDALPAPGEVEIASTDYEPFACCDGKTGCEITQPSCGLNIGSNCLPPVPTYNEFMTDDISARLIPCGSVLNYNDETNQWDCLSVIENGYWEPYDTLSRSFIFDIVVLAPNCYYHDIGPDCYYLSCRDLAMGWDSFSFDPSSPINSGEGVSPCDTLDVDYLIQEPSPPPGPYCSGGTPPEQGFCTNDNCCVEGVSSFGCFAPSSVSVIQCPLLDAHCGRKILNWECDHVRTDYTVGDLCLPIPNATLEFA